MDNAQELKRGTVVWYFPVQYGLTEQKTRPGIVVSPDVICARSSCVCIVPVTSQEKKEMWSHVEIRCGDIAGTALCENITCASKDQIVDVVGSISENDEKRINLALANALGIPRIVGALM